MNTSARGHTATKPFPGIRGRRSAVVLSELLHGIAFVPVLVAEVFAILVFPIAVPLIAQAERLFARLTGHEAASAYPAGVRYWTWLTDRITHKAFWRQDLPIVVGATILNLISFIFLIIASIGVMGMALPFVTSPERPMELSFLGVTATRGSQVWWVFPLGLIVLLVGLVLLYITGRLRGGMAIALSDSHEEELVEELTAEVGHLTAGRATLIDAFDAERARIERELHDGTQRYLVAVTMHVGLARLHAEKRAAGEEAAGASAQDSATAAKADTTPATSTATAAGAEALMAHLAAAQDQVEDALKSLRETVHGIRPAILTERGLIPALRDLASRSPLPTSIAVTGTDDDITAITSPVATTIYFAVSEALSNAAKHGGPRPSADVNVVVGSEILTVTVSDDGAGGMLAHATSDRRGSGIAEMTQRVESIGGRLTIDSPEGRGTTLRIDAPLVPSWERQ